MFSIFKIDINLIYYNFQKCFFFKLNQQFKEKKTRFEIFKFNLIFFRIAIYSDLIININFI